MSYNNELLSNVSPIVVDVETAGLPNAADYLEPVLPAKNLVDPVKIAADIEKRTAERDDKLALDWNVGRIVAIAWWTEQSGVMAYACDNEDREADCIESFWHASRHRTIVGYNLKQFDLRFMIQRSRYLGIAYPDLDLGKYTRKGIVDLFSELTFNDGTYDQGAMRRTLKAFCRRFGIPITDEINGADVPALVAAGDWAAIESHVISDVEATVALARRLGVLQPVAEAVAL